MTWDWFGVKTLYRTSAEGKPDAKDRFFASKVTLIEERVVLFRARSFDEAIRQAEREGRIYARETDHRNPYGQRVRQRYLGACDAYQMIDPPAVRVEVFSSTELVGRSLSDRDVVRNRMGREKRVDRRRRNVLDSEFAGRAKREPSE